MDLTPSPLATEHLTKLRDFMTTHVKPAEAEYERWRAASGGAGEAPVIAGLKAAARELGLWNLSLLGASGLSNLDYCYLAEMTGRSPDLAPAAINGAAPDSVNMVMLGEVATSEQTTRWLEPLKRDEFKSAFAMTEPDVASSDATTIETRIDRDGDDYVINGRKWYITGATNPRLAWLFVMGCTDPSAPAHRRHSVVGVPADAAGVKIVRSLPVLGYDGDQAEIELTDVRVPVGNLLGAEGGGFRVGQVRLAAARLQHCMRMIGLSERALEMTCERALDRVAFGKPLAEHGTIRSDLAESRLQLDQARLLVLRTAYLVDTAGARAAQSEISQAKVIAMRTALDVIGRAMSVHGARGLSDEIPLARWWAMARGLHIADGPEEVHMEVVARHELDRAAAHRQEARKA